MIYRDDSKNWKVVVENDKIFTQSCDPREDFNELENLKYSRTFELFEFTPLYIKIAAHRNP